MLSLNIEPIAFVVSFAHGDCCHHHLKSQQRRFAMAFSNTIVICAMGGDLNALALPTVTHSRRAEQQRDRHKPLPMHCRHHRPLLCDSLHRVNPSAGGSLESSQGSFNCVDSQLLQTRSVQTAHQEHGNQESAELHIMRDK